MTSRVQVLFVCMGNICRSPTAEGVFAAMVAAHGLTPRIKVDSAGTHAYHVGEPPDVRAVRAAQERDYDLTMLRARKLTTVDLQTFDYVLAMDQDNLRHMQKLVTTESNHWVKPELLLNYHPNTKTKEVPDPYYGTQQGFEEVLDLVEPAAFQLLKIIVDRYQL